MAIFGQFLGGTASLTKDKNGIWSTTIGPILPGVYQYSFIVDSLSMIDPNNRDIKPIHHPRISVLNIPGDPPLLHDFQNIPHGTLHKHWYRSTHLGTIRSIEVYTPPGYEASTEEYPTLYLLPGSGDTESTWSLHGRAHWIMDNLISQTLAIPMIMVMLDGETRAKRLSKKIDESNTEDLMLDLVNGATPLVESTYRVKRESPNLAIFGVSRGGGQSLIIGLTNHKMFSWIGGASSVFIERKTMVSRALLKPADINKQVRLLWLSCGDGEELLLKMNDEFGQLLSRVDIHHEFHNPQGIHGWQLWRTSLAEFATRIFRES